MLAEPISFTKDQLPKELRDKAIVLAGEPSWPALEALQVVSWLGTHGREVAGVEIWREKEGKPLFVGSSDFSPEFTKPITPESISWCAHKAKVFISRFRQEQGALFNIAWTEPSLDISHKANAV